MGISLITATQLLELGRSTPWRGAVIQLGRQHVAFDHAGLDAAATRAGAALGSAGDAPLQPNPFLAGGAPCLTDSAFFGRLGFGAVESLDVSDFEGATHVCDLNGPVPGHLHDRFDLVLDGGTMEHVFHVPECLANIFRMLKVGGVVVHVSPVHNFFEHGFYDFNPTLFFDYYAENKFDLLSAQLVRFVPDRGVNRGERLHLVPPVKPLSELGRAGSLDRRCLTLFMAARKTGASTAGRVPRQSYYAGSLPAPTAKGRRTKLTKVRRLARQVLGTGAWAAGIHRALDRRVLEASLPWERI